MGTENYTPPASGPTSVTVDMPSHYRVVPEGAPDCEKCSSGQLYTIVSGQGDQELGISTSWMDLEIAEDTCDFMNMAFETGKESTDSQRSALIASLKELVSLAELGDADQDKGSWHPALNDARELLKLSAEKRGAQ